MTKKKNSGNDSSIDVSSTNIEGRVVYLSGEFSEEKAKEIIEDLLQLEYKNPVAPILMIIDSHGGYVDSFLAIHDIMKMLLCPVSTICVGKAMSAGQMLLMSGTQGMRFATENSRIMMHQISSSQWGPLRDLKNDLEEIVRLQIIFENMIRSYTNLTKAKIKKLMQKDSFLSAEEALECGIIDKIISSTQELKSIGIVY